MFFTTLSMLEAGFYLSMDFPVYCGSFTMKKTQKHVEKPVCIFMSVGGQDVLNPAMPV